MKPKFPFFFAQNQNVPRVAHPIVENEALLRSSFKPTEFVFLLVQLGVVGENDWPAK